MNVRGVVALLAIAAVAGCGSSREAERAEAAAEEAKASAAAADQAAAGAQAAGQASQQGAQQFAQGMQQLAQGLQQMQAAQGDPIKFEDLQALLPETAAGWTRRTTRGEQINMPFKVSRAEARYDNGASTMEIEIVDASLNQLLLAPLSMFMVAGFEERSSDGYKKYSALGGAPGFEEWQSGAKRAEVTVIVGKRFVVQATGHNVDSVDPVRAAVQALDLTKLATLK